MVSWRSRASLEKLACWCVEESGAHMLGGDRNASRFPAPFAGGIGLDGVGPGGIRQGLLRSLLQRDGSEGDEEHISQYG